MDRVAKALAPLRAVDAGLEPLDFLALQKQGNELAAGYLVGDVGYFFGDPAPLRGMVVEVLGDALADVGALAHVDHVPLVIVEVVYPRILRDLHDLFQADLLRQPRFFDAVVDQAGGLLGAVLPGKTPLQQFGRGTGIGQGAVAGLHLDAEVADEVFQAVTP